MKFLIVYCLVAVTLAAPQFSEQPPVAILRNERVDQGDGNFYYAFALDNGIETEVSGTPGANGAVVMQGFYVLPRRDGTFVRVNFIADENGFQPERYRPHPNPADALEPNLVAEGQTDKKLNLHVDLRTERLPF